jgi:hypothetical protein
MVPNFCRSIAFIELPLKYAAIKKAAGNLRVQPLGNSVQLLAIRLGL